MLNEQFKSGLKMERIVSMLNPELTKIQPTIDPKISQQGHLEWNT
jgi:hypothetical protein